MLELFKRSGGITPAYAGNTSMRAFRDRQALDHPRLRGEYLVGEPVEALETGSPPLTRGIQRRAGQFHFG